MTDALNNGERQVAPTLDGIRRDHRARYEWVARNLPPASRVIDLACGVGYGAFILAEAGHTVLGVDRSAEAIAYAEEHYAHPRARYVAADALAAGFDPGAFDAAVSFETIEHLADPRPMLTKLRAAAPVLYASVPNETVFPFRCAANEYAGWAHHHRHYTRDEFAGLLWGAGWSPLGWYGQEDRESGVGPEVNGRTLVAIAERDPAVRIVEQPIVGSDRTVAFRVPMPAAPARPSAPAHVAIVGLGPSSKAYFETVMRLGGRKALADETWAVNALGDVLACDRVFHMDDVAVQELRAAAKPEGNIARMVDWLKTHPGPIYTSIVRDGYPGMVPFPLEDVLNAGGVPYFNNTVAYAIAFARFIGVKKLSLYGVDFTRPNVHQGEQGRACCEFWLGLCTADGMEIDLPSETTLMDACADEEHPWFYGYDAVDLTLGDAPDGKVKVQMAPCDLPTAEAVEHRYDHTRHPNRLMQGAPA